VLAESGPPARTCIVRPVMHEHGSAVFRKPPDLRVDPAARTSPDFRVSFRFALEDKGTLLIQGRLGSHVLHAAFPVGAQVVEPQAILLLIHRVDQPVP